MDNSLECPVCEAEIPVDDDAVGDLVVCSYCQMTLKIVMKKDRVSLTEDWD